MILASFTGLCEVSPQIGGLKHLKELYLGGNDLKTLPDEMIGLKDLTYLHFTGNPFKKIPPVIFSMVGIETLWLEACQ